MNFANRERFYNHILTICATYGTLFTDFEGFASIPNVNDDFLLASVRNYLR
jgi:hypothetical protein